MNSLLDVTYYWIIIGGTTIYIHKKYTLFFDNQLSKMEADKNSHNRRNQNFMFYISANYFTLNAEKTLLCLSILNSPV